ncbi:MAG: TylF/MycF/NovP-related O-methyltransferase [Planctomycetota bacterium]
MTATPAGSAPAPPASASPPKRTMTYNRPSSCPDLDPAFGPIYESAKPYTMTSLERMYGVYQAVKHAVRAGLPGDIVECGVWKGGSSMVAALTLLELGETDRTLWLYDTFEGMTEPGNGDVDFSGEAARDRMRRDGLSDPGEWCRSPLDAVRQAMASTGYPEDRVRYVRGRVEDTLPDIAPAQLAVLRLDTDWYASTRHELVHLFPRLVRGGVLLIDDYGHWQGCRRAVDEYLADQDVAMLLARQDYTGRMGIKP